MAQLFFITRWASRLLALAACALAGYLFWSHASGGSVAGCSQLTGFDCEAALSSRWATWLGVPVALLGALTYGVIFVTSWGLTSAAHETRMTSWRLFSAAVFLAGGAALWFLGLQLFGSSPLCLFCILIHGCGLAIATLVASYALAARIGRSEADEDASVAQLRQLLTAAPSPHSNVTAPPEPRVRFGGAVALVGLLALIGGQLAHRSPTFELSTAQLDQEIRLDGPESSSTSPADAVTDTQSHVVHRVDPSSTDRAQESDAPGQVPMDGSSGGAATTASRVSPASPGDTPRERSGGSGSRRIKLLQEKIVVDVYDHAVLGSPDAEHILLEFFDFTCSHCREMHKIVAETLPRYGDQVAVVMLPVPLDVLCNRYVRKQQDSHRGACKIAALAGAVAQADPASYERFHAWLMEDEKAPTYARSLTTAYQMVDESDLRRELRKEVTEERVQQYIQLFFALQQMNPKLQLPLVIVGDRTLTGKPESAAEFAEVLEETLGIRPVGPPSP